MQIKNNKKLRLRSGANSRSSQKFRLQGAEALSSIGNGVIATLQTKTGQYRIIEERDFQEMYGLARDVDRLRGGLRFVILAVRAAQKHPEPENLHLLAQAVAMLGDLPELPTRKSFERLVPENFDLDEDDEVMLDPDEIERPLQSENAIDNRID
jgi:hypothetical protein